MAEVEPLLPADERDDRRRGDHRGRWLYGNVDRPPSEGARTGAGGRAAGAGHLRRRAIRAQRRLRPMPGGTSWIRLRSSTAPDQRYPPRGPLSEVGAGRGSGTWCEQHDVDAPLPPCRDARRVFHHRAARRPAAWARVAVAPPARASRTRFVALPLPDGVAGALRISALRNGAFHAGWGHRATGAAGAGPATGCAWNVASSSTSSSRARPHLGGRDGARTAPCRSNGPGVGDAIGSRPTRWSWR